MISENTTKTECKPLLDETKFDEYLISVIDKWKSTQLQNIIPVEIFISMCVEQQGILQIDEIVNNFSFYKASEWWN